MSQFNNPVRRTGGQLDVFTSLLAVAFLVLASGVAVMAMRNIEHSGTDRESGSFFKLVR